jgi:tRNA threonylcarbamoyladenosine biosynthesis protein TsaE
VRRGRRVVASGSAEETEATGKEIAETLRPGDVVIVRGDLGAGKTTLIRGACRALGVDDPVTSPTFTLGRRYRGRVPVAHLDLYRLSDLAGEEPALLEDYLDADTVTFVEWPAVARPALGDRVALEVRMEHQEGHGRRIEFAATPHHTGGDRVA